MKTDINQALVAMRHCYVTISAKRTISSTG